jgi:molybdopterin molybdotransferase
MISVKKAQSIINDNIRPLGSETILLKNVGNRINGQDIIAPFSVPSFDNSAMDGFAVRAVDTEGAKKYSPITFMMVGVSSAGVPSNIILQPGECVQCMTGGKIPEGADSIVIVENSSGFSDSKTVEIYKEANIGDHIRRQGEEIKEGNVIISKGTCITPGEIGVLATFGYEKVSVMIKPKIAIFVTGNELVEPGNKIKSGQIYNSNLYMLSGLAEKSGVEIVMSEVVKDDKNSLRKLLSNALQICDIIISSGGVSMGRFDYVREVYNELGVQEHFWKVAQKPGKPLFFGTIGTSLIFGLPGNPISSLICYVEYIHPTIYDLQNRKRDSKHRAILVEDFAIDNKKHRYLFGQSWIDSSSGKLLCSPSSKRGSHMLTATLESNCILESPPCKQGLKAGDEITINLLNWRNF